MNTKLFEMRKAYKEFQNTHNDFSNSSRVTQELIDEYGKKFNDVVIKIVEYQEANNGKITVEIIGIYFDVGIKAKYFQNKTNYQLNCLESLIDIGVRAFMSLGNGK